jgi:acyl-ACP thioesterase
MQKTQEERWSFSWEREVEFADLDTNAHVNSVILLRTSPALLCFLFIMKKYVCGFYNYFCF